MPITVFAQQPRPSLDVDALIRQARQFFATTLDVEGVAPEVPFDAAARVRLPEGERLVSGRLVDDADVAAAERAEALNGHTGLSLLAKRCGSVWGVETVSTHDLLALRIAAILASLLLGPILLPEVPDLIGVRTARERVERR